MSLKIIEQEKLIKLLSKRNRHYQENEIVLQMLLKYQYFRFIYDIFCQQLPQDNMLNFLKLEFHQENSIIFNEKEKNNGKIYMIIQGNVQLLRNSPFQHRIFSSSIQISPIQNGYFIRELQQGDGFGEKSFLSGLPRSLTAQAQEKTTLLILDNTLLKGFEKYISETLSNRKDLIFSFFPQVKTNYSNARIESIFYSFSNLFLSRDELLFEENKKGNEIYILCSGSVIISKNYKNENLTIAIQENICFLGEELYFQNHFNYNIKVQSFNASFLKIKLQDLNNFLPDECKNFIKQLYKTNSNHRNLLYQQVIDRFEKQQELQRQKIESRQSLKFQQQLNIQGYSNSETELHLRFDKDVSSFRNFVSIRTSSLYVNSSKGFKAQNFNNFQPSFIIDQQYKLLKEPLNPIDSPFDFGKGEAEEMKKRAQVQLCVMNMEKINYLSNNKRSPKINLLRNQYLKSYQKQQRKSLSQLSISTGLSPQKRVCSPEGSAFSISNF